MKTHDILNQTQANDSFGIIMLRILVMMPTLFIFIFTIPILWFLGVKYSRRHMSDAANLIVENQLPKE
jgi:hypothetical protein